MKNYITILLLALFSLLTACNDRHPQKKINTAEQKKPKIVKHYTCTMHPGVITDKPGVCPKCGMELVLKEN